MSLAETTLLGAIAGFTIFLGLPVARLELRDQRIRVALAMFSVGVLAFLFVDIFEHGLALIDEPIGNHDLGAAIPRIAVLGVGFAAGTVGLAWFERRVKGKPARPPIAGGDASVPAIAPAQFELDEARARALRTGLMIASAIGLHNFAEGLAIGVSAKSGEIGLATVLIIGFALHNATEGFGIVGPLGGIKPSWRWLGLAGLIGGGPTFIGSIVGYQVNNALLEMAFYSLAGAAVFYVIGEIWHAMRRFGHKELGLAMLSLGFMAGVITDMVVTYGGG